jgi:hypothetical protein
MGGMRVISIPLLTRLIAGNRGVTDLHLSRSRHNSRRSIASAWNS